VKAIRFDVTVAACALLISAIASAASVYQTHVIAQQFSATVWPYISFTVTRDATHLSVTMRNDGLGPALIRSAEFTESGKRVPSLDAIVDPMVAAITDKHEKGTMSESISSIGPGDVVPANQQVSLLAVSGAPIVDELIARRSQIGLSVCYCSLLGRCWMKKFEDPSADPQDVAHCPTT
jgi:hypothetical protein